MKISILRFQNEKFFDNELFQPVKSDIWVVSIKKIVDVLSTYTEKENSTIDNVYLCTWEPIFLKILETGVSCLKHCSQIDKINS